MRLPHLKIQTKDQRLIPLEPNTVQARYLTQLGHTLRHKREIILKARQFGFSTLLIALMFQDTVNTPNTVSVIIAHDQEATENLFQMVSRFWENLPDGIRPPTRYANRRELYFPDRNSRILVMTAGKKRAGRSYTINNLHCSEAAFWEHSETITGLFQAVPASGFIAVESTANGTGGQGKIYHDLYETAKSGTNGYTARFYAWWEHDEYEADPPAGFRRTDEEVGLAIRLDLDHRFGRDTADRKLYWRRLKKAEPGMGAMFAQEYPSDDEEAFLAVTDAFFTDFDPARHGVFEDEVRIEKYWQYSGSYDWGYGSPASFGLRVVDDRGRVIDIDERYQIRATDPEQAAEVVACIKSWGLRLDQVPIYADPSMWAKKTDHMGRLIANVDAFLAAGLRMVPASNDRKGGWANCRRYLHDLDEEKDQSGQVVKRTPFWRYLKGRRPNLVRTITQMVHDENDREDLDTDKEDHAVDEWRYGLAARPRPSDKKSPEEKKREADIAKEFGQNRPKRKL